MRRCEFSLFFKPVSEDVRCGKVKAPITHHLFANASSMVESLSAAAQEKRTHPDLGSVVENFYHSSGLPCPFEQDKDSLSGL